MSPTKAAPDGAGWLVFAAERRKRAAAVVLPWERRGDFQRLVSELSEGERLAWRRIKRRDLHRHLALIDALAAKTWLRIDALDAVDAGGRPLRLRVDDEAVAARAKGATSVRVVPRKTTAGVQLARWVASALVLPDDEMTAAQLEVAAAARARWARAAAALRG